VQASIYDVPGGYRAVMFDRFSGVKGVVRVACICKEKGGCNVILYRLRPKAHISSSRGCRGQFFTMSELNHECVPRLFFKIAQR
jgi:hypothetical protein